MSLGMQYIKSVIAANNTSTLRDIREEYLAASELSAFRFLKSHLKRHGVLPDPETVRENGYRLSRATEPPAYYADRLKQRYVFNVIRERTPEISGHMKSKDLEAALSVFREIASLGSHILDADTFSNMTLELTELAAEYERLKETGEEDVGIPFGWPSLDAMTDGMQGGDLIVLAGRPNVGKSYVMLAAAYHAWKVCRQPLAIISMEMTRKQMARRWLAFDTKANPSLMRHAALSSWAEERMRRSVSSARRMPAVHISAASMRNKTTSLVEQALEEHDPAIVFIDAAYRLRPQEKRYNMAGHELAEQTVGELKQLALDYNKPIVAVNQYNRSVKQRGQKTAADLGSAKGTDSWEQDSSIFLGVRFGDAPFEKSTRNIDLTKNREGPTGTIKINSNFSPIDFSELEGAEQFGVGEDSDWHE